MGKRHYERERYYETVFVVKPTLTEEEYRKVVEQVKNEIVRKGGEILYEEDWGLRQFAYPIEKFNHGRYYLIQFRAVNTREAPYEPLNTPNELEFFYRVNENIIRWLTSKIKKSEVRNLPKQNKN
jgi:small subunit ribosomal protein S6